MGRSWDTLLYDYNILKGGLWVSVPVTTLVAPHLIGSLVDRWGA